MRRAATLALLLAGACAATPPPARIAAAPNDGLPLGTLPRQTLGKGKCAVFLWKADDRARLLLMAAADPPAARIVLDGRRVDLPRVEGEGDGPAATRTVYAAPGVRLTLDLVIQAREGLADGALIPSGSLALDRDGQDGIVLPVAGLLGCER